MNTVETNADGKAPELAPQGLKSVGTSTDARNYTAFGEDSQPLLTVFSSDNVLTKTFYLDDSDELQKRGGAKLGIGKLRTVALQDADHLASIISKLTPKQMVCYGYCHHEKAFVASKSIVEDLVSGAKQMEGVTVNGRIAYKDGLPIVSRTRGSFDFLERPGIMMLDYDSPRVDGVKDTSESFLLAWYAMATKDNSLNDAPYILTYSASSLIYKGDEMLKGVSGVRVLVFVKDASDIERAGKALFDRLLLDGHGYAEVYENGQIAIKTLCDRMVWTPEHPDFIAGAHCEPPLEQKRPYPQVFNNDAPYLDTKMALPDLSMAEKAKLAGIIDELRKGVAAESRSKKTEWAEKQARNKLEKEGLDPDNDTVEFNKARQLYLRAADSHLLMGDYELLASTGQIVTVGEMLDNPGKWNSTRFADPIERDYGGGDTRICYARLLCKGKSYLYSHAHGGRRFFLCRALETIQIQAGERATIVDRVLGLFRIQGDIYDRAGSLVKVGDDGTIHQLSASSVQLELDRRVKWQKKIKVEGGKLEWCMADAPKPIAEGIIAAVGGWGLPKLVSVIHAPTYEPSTGRIIDAEGFDSASGLLLVNQHMDAWPGVPDRPTPEQVAEAVALLWKPFAEFPFCGPIDRGVMLSTILTAVCRQALPTAPGTAFVAPSAGSGKSLLAECVSYLGGMATPSVMAGTSDDEEFRKRLLAIGLKGAAVSVLDNLVGQFGSSALCAWLTTEIFEERVLGTNVKVEVPTRMLLLLTGNNLRLKGDLCRRIMTCRIDPGIESPWRRSFDIAPARFCKDNYLAMVGAALTVLKYYHDKPAPMKDRTASYELWSDTVRKVVILVKEDGLLDVEDPTLAFDEALAIDPETMRLRALLTTWQSVFGGKALTVAQCIERIKGAFMEEGDSGEAAKALHGALEEVAGEGKGINTRRLGNWIESRQGRIIDGLQFKRSGEFRHATKWCVIAGV